ncbi:MAG: DUF5677 domain-containing protein [Planctomycetota bacterium]
MPDTPYRLLLDRDDPQRYIENNFAAQLELLVDLVNYGTNLIVRCYQSSGRRLEDAIVLFALTKHAFSMLDAYEVLFRNGATYAARLQTRSLLDVSLSIDWILKDETERRSRAYYVATLRDRRSWCRRLIPGTPEHAQYASCMQAAGRVKMNVSQQRLDEYQRQAQEIDAMLATNDFREMNEEAERLRQKKNFEPSWHSIVGVRSVREIAKGVDRLDEYEVFYRVTSEVAHGSDYENHVRFEGNRVSVEPIRGLCNQDSSLLSYTIGLALRVIRTVIHRYRPGEVENLSRRYVSEWQGAYMSVPELRCEASIVHIEP